MSIVSNTKGEDDESTDDDDFNAVTGLLEGGVIGPDENPNNPDAEFLFTFAAPLGGERVPVQFPDPFPGQKRLFKGR